MTRKEDLVGRAKETTEQLLAEGVCLSDGECGITDRVILQALQQVEREVFAGRTCVWTAAEEPDGDISWDTSCEESFCFLDGGPEENDMKFCPYCGGSLEIQQKELG